MGKLYCLMGKSASGKDSIYKRLLEREDLKLGRVIPYTTRPIRSDETDGVDYYFCTKEQAEELERAGKMIELRTYHTVHGDWNYFTADDGQICLEKRDSLMVGTLESYTKIREYFGKDCVYPLYIEVDDGDRLQRALNRERKQAEPKYAEMCRRFLADEQDFSDENLAAAGITRRFQNTDLAQVTEEIAQLLAAERKA